jgi:hypothetical protein
MPDFNDANKLGAGKDMVDRLTNLIAIFEDKALDFSKNRAEGDDILGDAYDYLMRHFATESGKSKGQFYTPAEVSRVMARVIGIGDGHATTSTAIYDPTCGSGSLLLKVADDAGIPVNAQRSGKGRRHHRPGADEHDPAQQPRRGHPPGQHAGQSPLQGRRHPQDLRLRCRQSALQRQALDQQRRPRQRPLGPLQTLRHVKKRDIKQGAMQELLTGRKRLSKFAAPAKGYKRTEIGTIPADWSILAFGNIVGLYIDYRGRTPRKLGLSWGGGDILALSASNVQMGRIDTTKEANFGSEELYRK